jgi:hypothetical protein
VTYQGLGRFSGASELTLPLTPLTGRVGEQSEPGWGGVPARMDASWVAKKTPTPIPPRKGPRKGEGLSIGRDSTTP